MQQIIVSGVGGQGVLFITKLLAETALDMDCSVMISETHGMAQRGGNVISHLKVQKRNEEMNTPFPGSQEHEKPPRICSPLIRPGRADILLALHPDALSLHQFYLKSAGKLYCNRVHGENPGDLNATKLATELGSPVSANLVLLGFAVGSGHLFCQPEQVVQILKGFGGKKSTINIKAFQAGWGKAKEVLSVRC